MIANYIYYGYGFKYNIYLEKLNISLYIYNKMFEDCSYNKMVFLRSRK